jgi:hypothetical protein
MFAAASLLLFAASLRDSATAGGSVLLSADTDAFSFVAVVNLGPLSGTLVDLRPLSISIYNLTS